MNLNAYEGTVHRWTAKIGASKDLGLAEALVQQWRSIRDGEPAVVLGHADHCVIWGVLEDGALALAPGGGKHGVSIDHETILDLSVFDAQCELRLVRMDGLRGEWVTDSEVWPSAGDQALASHDRPTPARSFRRYADEPLWLLGYGTNNRLPAESRFVELSSREGYRHFPPKIRGGDGEWSAPKSLTARRYFDFDADGLLVDLGYRLKTLS